MQKAGIMTATVGVFSWVSLQLIFILNHNAYQSAINLGEQTFNDLLSGGSLTGEVALVGYGVRILIEQV